MNAVEEGKHKSHRRIEYHAGNNFDKYCEMAGFSLFYKNFPANNKRIAELSILQHSINLGLTAEKNDLRARLCKATAKLCGSSLLYSEINHNVQLKEKVNHSEKSLASYSDGKLFRVASMVNQEATKLKTPLALFGVTDEKLDVHTELISKFDALLITPSGAVNERKGVTLALKALLKENDDIVNLINIGFIQIADKYPDLYAGFLSASKVIVTGRTSLSLRAHVCDSVTLEGIKGVTVRITPNAVQNQLKPEEVKRYTFEKVTADSGIFQLKSIPEGVYDVVITKKGYQTVIMSITIADGDRYELNVNLVKDITANSIVR